MHPEDRLTLAAAIEPTTWLDDSPQQPPGVVARFIREAINKPPQSQQDLLLREQYLSGLVKLQRQLLANPMAWQADRIHDLLKPLGEAAKASRVCYFEMFTDSRGQPLARQIAEWCAAGIPSTLSIEAFQNIPVLELFADWWNTLVSQGSINLTANQFTPRQRQLLASPPTSVQSLLLLPLTVKQEFLGMIGFSNCQIPKPWSRSEVDLLQVATAAISLAIERQRAENTLKKAEANYRSMFENAVAGIFQSTPEGCYLTVNPMLARLYGYDSPEELTISLTDISRQLYVDPRQWQNFMAQIKQHGSILGFESQVYRKDGSIIWVSESARAIYDETGTLVGFEGTVEDITQRKQAEAEVLRRDRLLQGVAEASRVLLTTRAFEEAVPHVLETLGKAAEADRIYIYEHLRQDLNGEPRMRLRYEWIRPGITLSISQPHLQNQFYGACGLQRWYQTFSRGSSIRGIVKDLPALDRTRGTGEASLSILIVPIFIDDSLWGYIGFDACHREHDWSTTEESILVAIAAILGGAIKRQQTEAEMRHQAFHDSLTGLPNRTFFNEHLSLAVAQARRSQEVLAVVFLDLDRFKTINDTLGHAVGDQLLAQAPQRLMKALREQDLLTRWGGDEFTLILPSLSSANDAAKVAQRLAEALRPVFVLDGHELHITCSIGIALFPQDGDDMTTLLQNADAALYRAKEQGRNRYQFYTATINSEASQRLILENSLHHALERQEFVVYYQPQINVDTGQVVQIEALLRWRHPELGLVAPQMFIPMAEEIGLIVPMGEWVLQQVCAQQVRWRQTGYPCFRIAVNLSARQLQYPGLVNQVRTILDQTGLPASSLELEITETTAMRDVEATVNTLNELRRVGVRISMDDFGTGYSSLSYLKKFPINGLKIDRAFVSEILTNAQDRAMVKAIITMTQGLNLNVVAEGVETAGQLHCLRPLGCSEMQGYLFSQPLAPEDMTAYLNRYSKTAPFKTKTTGREEAATRRNR